MTVSRTRTYWASGRRPTAARQLALERAALENRVERAHAALVIRDERIALHASQRRSTGLRADRG